MPKWISVLPAILWSAAALSLEGEDPLTEHAVDCVIMPDAVVDVSSGVNGRLESIYVERGDTVEKDQLLAELESGVERANAELARARAAMDSEIHLRATALDYDERKKTRTDTLYTRNAVTPHEKDQADRDAALAEWRLRQAEDRKHLAQLELRRAEELLELRSVRSPISGLVVERFKWAGEFVEEEPILRVARLDPLRVEVVVPVAMYGTIDKNLPAQVVPETEPDSPRAAKVTVIDPMGDAASGTFRVRLELPNPGNRLLGGIKCRARLAQSGEHSSGGPLADAAGTAGSGD